LSEDELERGHGGGADSENEDDEDALSGEAAGGGNDDGWAALQAGLAEDAAATSGQPRDGPARPAKRARTGSAAAGLGNDDEDEEDEEEATTATSTAAAVVKKWAVASLFAGGGLGSSSSNGGGGGKKRLSAHQRKRVAAGLPANDPFKAAEDAANASADAAAAQRAHGGGGGVDYGSTGSAREEFAFGRGAFRDPSGYIGYGRTQGEAERDAFDPNAEAASKGRISRLKSVSSRGSEYILIIIVFLKGSLGEASRTEV
jgi:hypothetical protein